MIRYSKEAWNKRSDANEAASILGLGGRHLYDHGHGDRLQGKGWVTMSIYSKLACFAGGALFGSFGIKLLSSKDAKKAYVHATAVGLRMKDSVMETVTTVQENAADILASAKDLNEARAAKEAEEIAASKLDEVDA